MRTFYEKYCRTAPDLSQNGEAGIINECLKRIGITGGFSVEFGAPTKAYCSNTFHLPEPEWEKWFYDINPQEPGVMKAEITPENINQLVPPCNVLSIDCDGPDYELFRAWNNRADIVIIEINSSIDPTEIHYSKEKGVSYKLMCITLIERGYFIICHTGNLIAVDAKYQKLFPEIPGDPITDYKLFFNTAWLKQH